MENYNPLSAIKINEFIKIANKSWPKGYHREISDITVIQEFYNSSYKEFHNQIEDILNKYNPAAWIRIAYINLEYWTLELFKAYAEKKDLTLVPTLFIPIGRYGWRYIIEISLENLSVSLQDNLNSERPSQDDIDLLFTYLFGLSYCNEISNYIHYFKNRLKESKIIFSNTLYSKIPDFEDDKFINNLIKYLHLDIDFTQTPEFDYRKNSELLIRINSFLKKNFHFTIDDIDVLSEILVKKICPQINASNLIIPVEDLIDLIKEVSSLSRKTISGIVNLIFFDIDIYNYEKRDFLKRSQNIRMLNFAGCKFVLTKNLNTIYDDISANLDYIKSARQHCILSFVLIEEWKLNFISRLVYGQRSDLKNLSPQLNQEISALEHYFHRNIFENALKNILINIGLPCKSVEEVERKKIPCGEIDAIAVDVKNKILYIIEAKNTAPSKDARAFARTISDHYKQKNYHSKFLKKIEWAETNLAALSKLFEIDLDNGYSLEKYFITGSPSPLKFLIDEYSVLTYHEFNNLLNHRYEKCKP